MFSEKNNLMQASIRVRIMTLIAAFLICLAVEISWAAKLQCPNAVSCICGNKEESVTVCVTEDSVETDLCARLSNCESCQEGLNICSKCPEGFEGPFCTRRLIKFRQKRQLSHSDRGPIRQSPGSHSTPGARSCPFLDSRDMESIECIQTNSEEETCTGKCWKGYHFMLLDFRAEITLTCRGGVWTPLDSFPKCRRNPVEELTFCPDPGINANSVRQPSQPPSSLGFRQGSRLVYSCDPGYNLQGERNIFCLTSGEWSEDRPRCIAQSAAPGPRNPPPLDESYVPELCEDATIDTITRTQSGDTYVFKGNYYWKVLSNGRIAEGYPRKISDDWDGLEGNLDASVTLPTGKTYFFKGRRYWRFTNKKMESGFPKLISETFKGIPDNLDAAVVWSGNGNPYFFKGNKYWQYDDTKDPPISTIYPQPISEWSRLLAGGINAALQWENNRTYFFKGDEYYRYNDTASEVDSDPPYPLSTAREWFGC